MSGRTVLLIDDEVFPAETEGARGYMWYYAEALRRAGILVIQADGSDAALRILEEEGDAISLIVLDIMMPPGEALIGADTAGGLWTGVKLADAIRQRAAAIPVIVLTNVDNSQVLSTIKGKVNVKSVVLKQDTTPKELLRMVEEELGR